MQGSGCESDQRRPSQFVSPIDCLGRDKLLWIVEAADSHIDAPGLRVTDPADGRSATSAECPRNTPGRIVGGRRALRDVEVFDGEKDPGDGLSAHRAPAIRTVTYENLIRWTLNHIADVAATAATGRIEIELIHVSIRAAYAVSTTLRDNRP